MAERLGRYTLDRRIAQGGMAEVFLARQQGPEGFEKLCVVKRMLPNLAEDPHFVRMFFDEARLAAQLNHPLIAQIFDFGEQNGTYYLAMEYVPGSNLRALVKDFAKRAAFIPVGYCARIISHVAMALDYAHTARGSDGKALQIIHRDVSPQNVLLGSSGVVKLIDFGVAKASTATVKTAAGLVKGKFAYMSPEQIRGQELDCRSDVFALGLVLYELLACTRAFQGKTDVEITRAAVKLIMDPIEKRRPDVPAPLRAIVNRALQKNKEERYQTAGAMSAELERFLTETGVTVNASDLAALVSGAPVTAPPPSVVARAMTPSPPPSRPPPPPPQALAPTLPPEPPTKQVTDGAAPPGNFWDNAVGLPTEVDPDWQRRPPEPPIRKGASVLRPGRSGERLPPPPRPRAVTVEQQTISNVSGADAAPVTKITPPRRPGASKGASRLMESPRPAGPVTVPVTAPFTAPSLGAAAVKTDEVVELSPYEARMLRRSFNRNSNWPWVAGIIALVLGMSTCLYVLYGKQFQTPDVLTVGAASGAPEPIAQPRIPAGEPVPRPAGSEPPTVFTTPDQVDEATSAALVLSSSPLTDVLVDGKAVGRTPVKAVVTAGEHTLIFQDEKLGLSHTRTVQVAQGEQRTEEWQAARGKVTVVALPLAEVFIAGRSLGFTPLAPIELWEGRHSIRFVNPENRKSETREVQVPPNAEVQLKVDLRK